MISIFTNNPNFLENVLETMSDGLMVVDKQGNIQYFNRAAEEITGYRRAEVVGKPCMMLDTDTCTILTESGRQKHCDLFKNGSVRNKKCRIRHCSGRSVYLMKNAVTLKDASGEVIGAVESMTDVTSLYLKEIKLEELKQDLKEEYSFHGLLGKSAPMLLLHERIKNAAASEAPVLIYGESGSGKNLVANAIHTLSRRKDGPMIQMNCASLNESLCESELFGHKKGSFTGAVQDRMGRFETANNGTFFLDEIADMPLSMQAKLLRVLEEKVVERVGDQIPLSINIRLISATNRDLEELIVQNRFRDDLYYRINSISIRVPSLRERREDIPFIAFHYLKKISYSNNKGIQRISPTAMEVLESYEWPGNVRQLISALEYAAVTAAGNSIELSDLPDYLFQQKNTKGEKKPLGREEIESTLSRFKGNKTLAAKHLGLSRVTLWKKLKEIGLGAVFLCDFAAGQIAQDISCLI